MSRVFQLCTAREIFSESWNHASSTVRHAGVTPPILVLIRRDRTSGHSPARIVRAHVFLYSSLYQIWHRGCFHRAHHRILTPLVITRKRLGGWSTARIDRPPPIIALLNSTLRGRAAGKEHPPRCFHTPPSLPSRHVISLLLQTAVDEARIRLIGLRRPGDRIKESG